MDDKAFLKAYNESRNGCNFFYRHSLARSFQYSDGVQECAEAGCYWLLDIAATELPQAMRSKKLEHCMFEVHVAKFKATLKLTYQDRSPPVWQKDIDWTDMPEGEYVFEIVDEGNRVAMILLSEH
jgi:hypothetical protein